MKLIPVLYLLTMVASRYNKEINTGYFKQVFLRLIGMIKSFEKGLNEALTLLVRSNNFDCLLLLLK